MTGLATFNACHARSTHGGALLPGERRTRNREVDCQNCWDDGPVRSPDRGLAAAGPQTPRRRKGCQQRKSPSALTLRPGLRSRGCRRLPPPLFRTAGSHQRPTRPPTGEWCEVRWMRSRAQRSFPRTILIVGGAVGDSGACVRRGVSACSIRKVVICGRLQGEEHARGNNRTRGGGSGNSTVTDNHSMAQGRGGAVTHV